MTEMDEIIAEDPQDPAHDGARDRVLIVDFGSQVTQLIARRVREAGVYSEIVPFDKAEAGLGPVLPKAIILSGGPASVHESGTPQAPASVFSAGVPVLGICYGEQAMVAALGGQVEAGREREFGKAELQIIDETPLFAGVFDEGERAQVWMSHGDRVTKLPPGFRAVGISTGAPFAAIADDSRLAKLRHAPIALAAGDLAHKIGDECGAFWRMHHLWVELHAVEPAGIVGDCLLYTSPSPRDGLL